MSKIAHRIANFFISFWPSFIVLSIILYGTLTSDPLDGEPLPSIPHIDKVIHFLMMGGLDAAILFDIRRRKLTSDGASSRSALSLSLILYIGVAVALFSIFDEWLQGQLAIGRPSDPLDAVANLLGILTASLLAPPILRKIFP